MPGVILLLCLVPAVADQSPDRQKAAKQIQNFIDEANRLRLQGKFVEAVTEGRKAVALVRRTFGDNAGEIPPAESWLFRMELLQESVARANTFRRSQQFDEAVEAAKIVLALERIHHSKNHPQVREAQTWLNKIQQERQKLFGSWMALEPIVSKSLHENKLDRAIATLQEILKLQQKALPKKHPLLAETLRRIARLEEFRGRFQNAEQLYEKALDVLRTIYESNDWRVIDVRLELAQSRKIRRRPKKIREQLLAAKLRLQKMTDQEGTPAVRQFISRAEVDLQLIEKEIGKDTRFYTVYAGELGTAYMMVGKNSKSLLLRLESERIRKRLCGEQHPDYVSCLISLNSTYRRSSDYHKANEVGHRAADLCKKIHGRGNHKYAICLNNLATNKVSLGQFTDAETLLRNALTVNEAILGKNHPSCGTNHQNLGELHTQRNRLKLGRRHAERALEIFKINFGEEHKKYLATLGNLAVLELVSGDPYVAQSHLKKVVEIQKRTLGIDHPTYGKSLGNLSTTYQVLGDYKPAEHFLRQSLQIQRRHMDTTFSVLSERQQLAMTRDVQRVMFGYLSLSARFRLPAEQTYQEIISWKGAVFLNQQHARLASGNPKLAPLLSDLQETSRALATLTLSKPVDGEYDRRKQDTRRLVEKKERLESELVQQSTEFHKIKQEVNLAQIKAVLPNDAALVDFIEYVGSKPKRKDSTDQGYVRQLLAFIIRPNRKVEQVYLGETEPISKYEEKWRTAIMRGQGGVVGSERGLRLKIRPDSTDEDLPQNVLRNLVWKPLEQHLEGVKTILVSPDGVISRLPLSALPGKSSDKYLIEERSIAVIPVPRQLSFLSERTRKSAETKPSLFLLGDVDFEADAGSAQPSKDHPTALKPRSATRFGNHRFSRLPGTRREIDAIAQLYKSSNDGGILTEVSGVEATENRFRLLAPKHRFIHMATHGFFASQAGENGSASQEGRKNATSGTNKAQQPAVRVDPGLLSGVVFAGANRDAPKVAAPGSASVTDDGILTATEVASLNLSQVELAVLSACETGLGKTASAEGVLGLQRAFQVAGVQSTITSLWKVDDTATQTLMTEFYRNLWSPSGKPQSKLEAIRQAQLTMLNRYDHRKRQLRPRGLKLVDKPASIDRTNRLPPYYWAAFVLSGDWR